jgi:glycosyltransferase involved in cell wall biosynthesis
MHKFFVAAEHVYEAQNSTGYFWSKLIEKLASTYGSTYVLTTADLENCCKKIPSRLVTYIELGDTKYNKNKLLTRFIGQARLALGFVNAMRLNFRKGDIVFTGTNPALLLVLLPWVKMLIEFKWCLLVHDVFPENLVPAKILKKNSILYWSISRYFVWAYSKADLLYVIGRDMQDMISTKIRDTEKIAFVPNWVDEIDVKPISRSESKILNRFKWGDKIVFQFFGNIGRLQGIDNILDAINLVKSEKAVFLFIGDGAKAKEVVDFCRAHPLANVYYYGALDQAEKNEGLAACDVALVTLEKGMEGLGVPSKSYFTMAADRPILAVMDPKAEISMMVIEHKIGWTCEPSNPVALASTIDMICEGFWHQQINSPREVFLKSYSAKISLEKLIERLDSFELRREVWN